MSNIFSPGKLILITGAAQGLGRELAYILDRIGCSLYLLGIISQRCMIAPPFPCLFYNPALSTGPACQCVSPVARFSVTSEPIDSGK